MQLRIPLWSVFVILTYLPDPVGLNLCGRWSDSAVIKRLVPSLMPAQLAVQLWKRFICSRHAPLDLLARAHRVAVGRRRSVKRASSEGLARASRTDKRDLALACTVLRMRLAAIACATATPSVWFSMSLDVGGIRLDANMRATRNAVEQAAGAMARSCPYLAAQHLADLCGLSLEEWAEQVTAEAQVEAEMWAEAEVSL